MSQTSRPVADPLSIAALDTERHVAASGWDQNPRLFALVPTAELLEREPHLRAQMRGSDLAEGALSAIEQEDLPPTSNLESLLGGIAWPDTRRRGSPRGRAHRRAAGGRARPPRPHRVGRGRLAAHPARQDVRLLVAVTRDGQSRCLLRQRANDSDDKVALGDEIAPGLVHALKATLQG